jgi:hypothetical protein
MPPKTIHVRNGEELQAATSYFQQHKGGLVALLFRYSSGNRRIREGDVRALLDAIETTQAGIQFLTVNPAFLDYLSESIRARFYPLLGAIPTLRAVHWKNRDSSDRSFSCLPPLTLLLRQARNLRTLKCTCAVFLGTAQDFHDFAAALQAHPTLINLHFPNCRVTHSPDHLRPFLEALAAIPNLTRLDISSWTPEFRSPEDLNHFYDDITSKALAQAYSHKHLISLRMDQSLAIQQSHHLSLALSQTQSITSLTIRLCLQEKDCLFLSHVLRTNISLTNLKVGLALPNKTHSTSFNDHHLTHVLSALEENSALTDLKIDYLFTQNPPSLTVGEAILTLLGRRNVTLTNFHIHVPCTSPEPVFFASMNFFLRLNQLGRKTLMENPNATRREWVHILERATLATETEELRISTFFYFLLENPSLCDEIHLHDRTAKHGTNSMNIHRFSKKARIQE